VDVDKRNVNRRSCCVSGDTTRAIKTRRVIPAYAGRCQLTAVPSLHIRALISHGSRSCLHDHRSSGRSHAADHIGPTQGGSTRKGNAVNPTRRFDEPIDDLHRPYTAAVDRYTGRDFRRAGTSGLWLPPLSLGLWYNFGDNRAFDSQRALLRHAFDCGIVHFDLANNYGPPPGSAEENFGRMMRRDFKPYRNEMTISTKAGWFMWPGPYGRLGPKKHLLASLDESLDRMSIEYVDIFYSHRYDPDTPVEETIYALDTAVRQGKALYVGISSYSAERTREAIAAAKELGTPLVVHQPAYSLLNRWIEDGLTDVLAEAGMAAVGFSTLAQGLLTDKFLSGAAGEFATPRRTFNDRMLNEENLRLIEELNGIAAERGQSLAQMSIAWALRTVTSALIGASHPKQIDENLAALDNLEFTDDELRQIDELAGATEIDVWKASSGL